MNSELSFESKLTALKGYWSEKVVGDLRKVLGNLLRVSGQILKLP
jgi:hypothetical protein